MNTRTMWIGIICVVALSRFAFVAPSAEEDPPNTGMADPVALEYAFDRFVASNSGELVLSLSSLRGLTTESLNAGGRVTIDLAAGVVASAVRLLPTDGTFDLWLVDNQPGAGHTTLAEPSDVLMRVGTYAVASGAHRLSVQLGPTAFTSFFPDRAFVVRSGQSPMDSFVLTGPSTLVRSSPPPAGSLPWITRRRRSVSIPRPPTRAADFATLVAQGRRLFLNETFNGNGRTCGTCHVESNNFTIDPEFISTLPASDPLFVAETNPALATLENPDLMRRLGLILVNADGFDPPRGFGAPRDAKRASAG